MPVPLTLTTWPTALTAVSVSVTIPAAESMSTCPTAVTEVMVIASASSMLTVEAPASVMESRSVSASTASAPSPATSTVTLASAPRRLTVAPLASVSPCWASISILPVVPASISPARKAPAEFSSQMLPLFCEALALIIVVASTTISLPAAPILPLPASKSMMSASTLEAPASVSAPPVASMVASLPTAVTTPICTSPVTA